MDSGQPGGAQAAPNDFDLLPYGSMPFQHTQPAHVAAVATLFSRTPPDVSRARVLEIGSAAGGNIIPLAARFPEATFLGVDLSQRHVEEGRAEIASLGLRNIRIEQGDISAFDLGAQSFDYIICHGVYSWAPAPVQDAIFRICANSLSDNGVAYVSYNVLPGWHLRRIVRDICLYHAGSEGSPQLRVARARWMLEQVAGLSNETSNFGRVLRDEAKINARNADSYILGEFLASENAPCYFHEFMERASTQGLAYVCEAGLAESIPENLGPERNQLIRNIAGDSGAALEQYMDFFTGRTFRRSLLMKARSNSAARAVSAQSIETLYLSCALMLDREASTDERFVFRAGEAQVATNNPILKAAFVHLTSLYPDNCSFAELVDWVVKRIGAQPEQTRAALSEAMLKAASANQISLSTALLRVGRAATARPRLWSVARHQAVSGQQWVSNQLHTIVTVHPALALLAPVLDGAHDHAALARTIAVAIGDGSFTLPDSQTPLKPEHAPQMLAQLLANLERFALLAAD